MSEPETEPVIHDEKLQESGNEDSEPENDDQNEKIEYQDSDDDLEPEKEFQEPSIFHQKYRSMKPNTDPEILKADLPNSNTFFAPKLGQKAPALLRPRIKRNFSNSESADNSDSKQEFYSLLSSYRDILHSANYYPDSTRPAYTAFALNHVLTAQKNYSGSRLDFEKVQTGEDKPDEAGCFEK
jgi:hypothetical protein